MKWILIVVFILVFMVANTIIERIISRNTCATNMDMVYDTLNGEEGGRKGKDYARKKTKQSQYIKKMLPLWALLSAVCLLLMKNLIISIMLGGCLCFAGLYYMELSKKKKRSEAFIIQFREALVCMCNSLKAGASLAMAMERCREELSNTLRNKKEKPMLKELEIMVNEINMGNSIAEVLTGFKLRVPVEEVESFVNAAVITGRTGGNLSEVMINVCSMISDRIQMKREIETLTAGKRSESRILTIAPILLVPMMAVCAPSYLQPMVDNLLGKILMAFAVVLLICNFIIGKKIVDIKL